MNIPLGEPKKRFVELSRDKVLSDLRDMMDKKETGYLVILANGKYGLQEGFVGIDTGSIFSSSFEYLKYNKRYHGFDALRRTLNLFLANDGLYDIYKWNVQQVELFKVFNEETLLFENITPAKFMQMIPKEHKDFEPEDLAEFVSKKQTREELVRKYNLEGINKEKPVEEQIADDIEKGVVDEHKVLEDMLEEYVKSSENEKPKMTENMPKIENTPPVGHGINKFKDLVLKEKQENK